MLSEQGCGLKETKRLLQKRAPWPPAALPPPSPNLSSQVAAPRGIDLKVYVAREDHEKDRKMGAMRFCVCNTCSLGLETSPAKWQSGH